MWTNRKKEFFWGIGVFVLIFFSANSAFDLVNWSAGKTAVPEMATVAD
jgi:hypothetical protein